MGIFTQNDGRAGGGGSRGSFASRLLMAALIALVGFGIFFFQQQKNPVTGERQYVTLTPNEEIRLGLEAAPQMASQMGGELPASDPRAQLVNRIGQSIVQGADAQKSPWKFRFHLLNDPHTVNAFALPGGQIFITLGLFNKLQTEAQLAGVLGHEMGHVMERHTAQQMAKSQLGQLLVMAVVVGAGEQNSSSNGPRMIATLVNNMMQLSYSRGDELEADTWGLKLMEQMGYSPKAMIEVMEILKAASQGGETLEILQTHPYPDRRIREIEQYLKKHPSTNQTEGATIDHGNARSANFRFFDPQFNSYR
jgi:predicted Zn-dependent protease